MNRLATATVTAVTAISLLMAPQQAAAEASDVAKVIAGIAAVAIIAKAAEKRNDRRKEKSTVGAGRLGSARDYGDVYRDDRRTYDRNDRRIIDGRIRDYGQYGPKNQRGYKKQALPSACLRTVETSRGNQTAYLAQCLERKYKFANKLPRSCETLIRTPRGFRSVYGARCLARDGWKVAQR